MVAPDTSKKQFPGRRALVVDDSQKTADLIKVELEKKGLEVLVALSADEATRLIIKPATRPDLVLLDINMPSINGAQLCRFIKGNEQYREIQVILCSSIDPVQLKQTVQDCGADGGIHKEAIFGREGLAKLLEN